MNGVISTDIEKTQAIVNWLMLKNIKGVRGFLGLAGYYRCFIRDFGVISKPLIDLLKKDQ